MALLTFCFLQEALSEFEVVNMDGKTTDALTVRTWLFVEINHFPTMTGSQLIIGPKKLDLIYAKINLSSL